MWNTIQNTRHKNSVGIHELEDQSILFNAVADGHLSCVSNRWAGKLHLKRCYYRCRSLTPNNGILHLKDIGSNKIDSPYPGLQEFILESPNFSGLHSKSLMQILCVVLAVYRTIFVSVTTNGNLGPNTHNHITHNRKWRRSVRNSSYHKGMFIIHMQKYKWQN